jgi:hypothetical protein
MAAGRHNLSRRAVLGVVAGACASHPLAARGRLLATVPVPAAAAAGRWTRALAAYRQAEARLAAFRRAESLLPPAARAFPACEPLEERFNDLECPRLAALRRLLRGPAPDLAALALKIELTIDDQAWELTGGERCLTALKDDARRLAHGG